uniref:Uncharacterized protein n=1 Tax=Anopheles minimus TaxID=112268 RepID=A0A182W9P9_9DIPT
MNIHQLHRQAHVALHLHLALEESLLGVQLAGDQINDIDIVHNERNVRFVGAAIFHRSLADLRIDHPVTFGTVRSVHDLEPVDTTDTFDQIVLIVLHRFLEHPHLSGGGKARIDGTLRIREAQPIQTDDDRSTETDVVLESQPGILNLPFVCLATQLPAKLGALSQTGRTERMSLGDQTSAGVHDDATSVRVVATINKLARLARFAQTKRFELGTSVDISMAMISTACPSSPCRLTKLSEATMQQAAPSLVGQHCSL